MIHEAAAIDEGDEAGWDIILWLIDAISTPEKLYYKKIIQPIPIHATTTKQAHQDRLPHEHQTNHE